jgi:hypothetical protein
MHGEFVLQERKISGRRPHGGVVQDNKPPRRLMADSPQPVTAVPPAVNHLNGTNTAPLPADNRPTHHGSETRQLELIAGRVPQHIKSEVLRIAKLKGWTESYTVRSLVEQALARTIAEQFGVMIKQTIQEAVREEFRSYTNRMGKLTYSAYLAAEQGRLMGIENLRVTLDDPNTLSQKITSSLQQARENLKFYNHGIEDVEKAATETLF